MSISNLTMVITIIKLNRGPKMINIVHAIVAKRPDIQYKLTKILFINCKFMNQYHSFLGTSLHTCTFQSECLLMTVISELYSVCDTVCQTRKITFNLPENTKET